MLRKRVEHRVAFAFPQSGAALLHFGGGLIVAGGEAGGLFFHQVSLLRDTGSVRQLPKLLVAKAHFPLVGRESALLAAVGGMGHGGELADAQ